VKELERLCGPGSHFSFFEKASIHGISFGVLEDWSLWLADRGLSPKTRRNVMGYFRAFLVWIQRRGELREIPRFPLPKTDEHEPRLLAIHDQDGVLAVIPKEDRGIFLALAHLGLRPGEGRALTLADYQDGWLHVGKAVKGKFRQLAGARHEDGQGETTPGERGAPRVGRAASRPLGSPPAGAPLPQPEDGRDLGAQGAGARLGARRGGCRAPTHLAVRGHQAYLRDRRDPPRRSRAPPPALPRACVDPVHAPLCAARGQRPLRGVARAGSPLAHRRRAARKPDLATTWRQGFAKQR
jgi:hypothetical protein